MLYTGIRREKKGVDSDGVGGVVDCDGGAFGSVEPDGVASSAVFLLSGGVACAARAWLVGFVHFKGWESSLVG